MQQQQQKQPDQGGDDASRRRAAAAAASRPVVRSSWDAKSGRSEQSDYLSELGASQQYNINVRAHGPGACTLRCRGGCAALDRPLPCARRWTMARRCSTWVTRFL